MLWRGLRHVVRGVYVDVGAAEPVADSVTCAFYRSGWHGLNLAAADRVDALRAARPHDVTLALPQTLSALIAEHVPGAVHFLRIDVPGEEHALLAGADLAHWRPWIVLVRAHDTAVPWEPVLAEAGYAFVWFDGLNRFYVAQEHLDTLRPSFVLPPNSLDGWRLPETATGSDPQLHIRLEAWAAAEQARGEAERGRQEAEHRRGEAEIVRQDAERGRGEAEIGRQGFERSRGETELLRQVAEQERERQALRQHTAEWSRQQAERRRELAETQREEADTGRRDSALALSDAALRLSAGVSDDHRQQFDELRRLIEQTQAQHAGDRGRDRRRRVRPPPPPRHGRDLRARIRRVAGAEGGLGKRLFRLAVYGTVRIGARLPGHVRMERGLRAAVPGLFGWVNVRYAAYRESWLGVSPPEPFADHPLTVAALASAVELHSAEEISMLARLHLQVARA